MKLSIVYFQSFFTSRIGHIDCVRKYSWLNSECWLHSNNNSTNLEKLAPNSSIAFWVLLSLTKFTFLVNILRDVAVVLPLGGNDVIEGLLNFTRKLSPDLKSSIAEDMMVIPL